MKVLYFHQHFSTPQGATGIRSYEMARRLIERGHEVCMVCGSYKGGTTGLTGPFVQGKRRGTIQPGFEVVEFDLSYGNADGFLKRTLTFLRFALHSIKLALSENYDLVFATTTPLTAGIPGIFARWLRRKPFVFEVRDLWPELPRAMGVIRNPFILWAMSMLEWLSYKSAHRLIGLSPGIVDGIARRGIPRAKITLIPNGCDIDIFHGSSAPWRPACILNTDLLALFAGTHGKANGLNAVLDAAVELQKRGRTDIKILLVGQGALKDSLVEKAKNMDLTNVVFHEPMSKSRLANLMASADVGLQILANVPAFYYGTSPNKFFDYLAAGLPVLNNYPGWLADLITEHECGFVVSPDNPQEFADALEWAADNRDELLRKGRRALALAKAQFDRKSLSNLFVDWLESTCTLQSNNSNRELTK
ncbi:glycosyltransferase family 4 protein [uncultured Pigmentiphaga sp.]|jgi:Glycosyltransferase|uniref:glycosyltransferase family 4 protein n=1 Tax=uncultured Pigmentiphaga sp. TaxID=340361 RepID=UPI002612B3F0|nr:glycosyltransferase family 4 protein [uncultured Pigmentiphaga sp.]